VGAVVVVGGGGDDDVVGVRVGLLRVQGGPQRQLPGGQVVLQLGVDDGGAAGVDELDLGRVDVQGHHVVVLGQDDGVGQPDVAGAGDGDLHKGPPWSVPGRGESSIPGCS